MNSSNNRSNTFFFNILRNYVLRKLIFSFLRESRKTFYLFKNGVIYNGYDDLQPLDIIKTNNRNLFRDKLNSFKALCIQSADQHNLSTLQRTHYTEWLDLPYDRVFNIITFINFKNNNNSSNNNKNNKNNEIVNNFINRIIEISFNNSNYLNEKEKKEYEKIFYQNYEARWVPYMFSNHFGLSFQDLQLYNQMDFKYKANVQDEKKFFFSANIKFENQDLFNNLFLSHRLDIVHFEPSLLDNPFFLGNKDIFRKLPSWDDGLFTDLLLNIGFDDDNDNDEEKGSHQRLLLFKWILKVSPLFKVFSTSKVSEMYSISISAPPNGYFSNFQYAFTNIEIFKYTLKNYNRQFLDFISREKSIEIKNFKIATQIINPNTIALYKLISTNSNDIKLIKHVVRNKLDIVGDHLLDKQENIDFLIDEKPEIFKVVRVFNQLKTLDPYFSILSKTSTKWKPNQVTDQHVFSKAIEINRFEYLYKLDPRRLIMPHLYSLSEISQQQEVFQFLLKQYQQIQNVDLNFIYHCLCQHSLRSFNFENVKRFYYSIDQVDFKRDFIQRNLIKSFTLLANSSGKKKENMIEIINFIKQEFMDFDISSGIVINGDHQHSIFFQDPLFYQTIQFENDNFSKLNMLCSSLLQGSLAHSKYIIHNMNSNELQELYLNLEKIIKFLIRSDPQKKLKSLIFLFDTFQDQLSRSILDCLVSMSLEYHNYHLIDILLHRTQVRLFKPTSLDDDYQMLKSNYVNFKKSICFTDYLKINHFKLNIDEKELKNHIFNHYYDDKIQDNFPLLNLNFIIKE
ncbi:hypothetical protein CYY_008895 [Polysphondylium violaceum]|uniref:Uncharacterized protein n=1 Tax=Polysphondylium violaceum TaxID=133409 RepID=A0A8J4PMH2_9MYCE|nr:hypothetical protein CYY_008895 [Polysphondylium violaceum]